MPKLLCIKTCQVRRHAKRCDGGFIINCNMGEFYELSHDDKFPHDCFRGELPPKKRKKKAAKEAAEE